jgi:hypothetical protein
VREEAHFLSREGLKWPEEPRNRAPPAGEANQGNSEWGAAPAMKASSRAQREAWVVPCPEVSALAPEVVAPKNSPLPVDSVL